MTQSYPTHGGDMADLNPDDEGNWPTGDTVACVGCDQQIEDWSGDRLCPECFKAETARRIVAPFLWACTKDVALYDIATGEPPERKS